jgi:hypothetical protein
VLTATDSIHPHGQTWLENIWTEKSYSMQMETKRAGVAVLKSDKIDFN